MKNKAIAGLIIFYLFTIACNFPSFLTDTPNERDNPYDPLSDNYIVDFAVQTISPGSLSVDNSIYAVVEVNFSRQVKLSTLDSTTFIVNDGTSDVSGTLTTLNSDLTVRFTPDFSFRFGQSYTVQITTSLEADNDDTLDSDYYAYFDTASLNCSIYTGSACSFGTNPGSDIVYNGGNYVYIAFGGSGIASMNVSDYTSTITLADWEDGPMSAWNVTGIDLDGSNLFFPVSDFDDNRMVWKTTTGDLGTSVGLCYPGGYPGDGILSRLKVYGNYVFACFDEDTGDGIGGDGGVRIINKSDMSEAGFFPIVDNVHDLCVDSDYIYAAAGDTGVVIIDYSNPAAPTQAGIYDPSYSVISVTIDGDNLFYGSASGTIECLDVSDPSAIAVSGYVDNVTGDFYDLEISGSYLYAAHEYDDFLIYDISTLDVDSPPEFDQIGSAALPSDYFTAITLADNVAFAASNLHAVYAVRIY